MNRRLALLLGLAASLAGSLVGPACQADLITIDPGYDLLAAPNYQTNLPYASPPSQVTSVPVAPASYDFGSGPVPVGTASWIDQRLSTITLANIGDSATTSLDFLVRQAVSLQVIQFSDVIPGAVGSGYVWQELDLASSPSGTLTVTRTSDTGGTFTESVTAKYDYYADSPTGAYIGTLGPLTVNITGTWQTTPPAGGLVIPGVNDDSFFITQATGVGPYSPNIPLSSAMSTPEPSSFFTTVSIGGLMALGAWRRRRANPGAVTGRPPVGQSFQPDGVPRRSQARG